MAEVQGWRRWLEIFRAYTAMEEPKLESKEPEPISEDEWSIDTQAMALESRLSHDYGERLIERAATIMRAAGRTCITEQDIKAAALDHTDTDALQKCIVDECRRLRKKLSQMEQLFEASQQKNPRKSDII